MQSAHNNSNLQPRVNRTEKVPVFGGSSDWGYNYIENGQEGNENYSKLWLDQFQMLPTPNPNDQPVEQENSNLLLTNGSIFIRSVIAQIAFYQLKLQLFHLPCMFIFLSSLVCWPSLANAPTWEGEVKKCPTNASGGGGEGALGIDQTISANEERKLALTYTANSLPKKIN